MMTSSAEGVFEKEVERNLPEILSFFFLVVVEVKKKGGRVAWACVYE